MITKTLQRFFATLLALRTRLAELWDTPTNFYKQQLLATELQQTQDKLCMHLGRISANRVKNLHSVSSVKTTEFNVYSQSGVDGIIQYLVSHILDLEQSFIEIGTEDYRESNTRFLMCNNLWQGLLLERDSAAVKRIHRSSWFWKYDLQVNNALVTAENINQEIEKSGITDSIGLLSIDIDGNDYWIWNALTAVQPIIVVIEYNSLFGNERRIAVPYRSDFDREESHYSRLHFGASLPALCKLAESKKYIFVGSNSFGNNAFFVQESYWNEHLPRPTIAEEYVAARFRESRDNQGRLSFVRREAGIKLISGLPVFNIDTQLVEKF